MPDEPLDRRIIERDIDRGTRFLRTLSTKPVIRTIMTGRGYTAADHQAGWDLLLFLMGYKAPVAVAAEEAVTPQHEAIAALDQWDGPNFSLARAALARLHPAQEAYIFDGLTAATGASAVGSVKTFLDRVAALRDGTDATRATTREADRAAVATLAKRKIVDEDVEARLRTRITQAMALAPAVAAESPSSPSAQAFEARARAFHAWLIDWRETARVAVSRRDYRIQLGLVPRRSRAGAQAPAGDGDGDA